MSLVCSQTNVRFSRLIYRYITEHLYRTAHRKQRYHRCYTSRFSSVSLDLLPTVLMEKRVSYLTNVPNTVTEQRHICFHCTKHSSSLTFPNDSRHKMMFSTNFYLLSLLHIKLYYFRLRKLLNH